MVESEVGIMAGAWLVALLMYGGCRYILKRSEKSRESEQERGARARNNEVRTDWSG